MATESYDMLEIYDDTKPNHMIFWLDHYIGNPKEYIHLKKAFGSNTDPRSGIQTMLTDQDYHNLLAINDAVAATIKDEFFLLQAFDNENDCLEALERNQDKRIFFIISGSMGRDIVPKIIKRYRNVFTDLITGEPYASVYVFCHSIEFQMNWIMEYLEYVQVFNFDSELLERITRDIAEYYIERGRRRFLSSDLKGALQSLYWGKVLRRRYNTMQMITSDGRSYIVHENSGIAEIEKMIHDVKRALYNELSDGEDANTSDDEYSVAIPHNTTEGQTTLYEPHILQCSVQTKKVVKLTFKPINHDGQTLQYPGHLLSPKHQDQQKVIIKCLHITYKQSFPIELVKNFVDEFEFIAHVLSTKDKIQLLLISTTIAKLVVPLIHNHFSVEKIYLYSSSDNQVSRDWVESFPKITGLCVDFETLDSQISNDIKSLTQRQLVWNRSGNLFAMVNSQKFDTNLTSTFQISTTTTNDICLAIMHCENPLFHVNGNLDYLKEFIDIDNCSQFIAKQTISSVFLIISGDMKAFDTESILNLQQIHAVYYFCAGEIILPTNTRVVSGQFNDLKDLSAQIHNDLDFYQQQRIHSPQICVFPISDSIKESITSPDDAHVEFLIFQMFINILSQIPPLTFTLQEILSEYAVLLIGPTDNIQNLIVKMNDSEISVYDDGPTILKIMSQIMRCKTFYHLLTLVRPLRRMLEYGLQSNHIPLPSIVYRAEIVFEKDLVIHKSNCNVLITITTFLLATRSMLAARGIAQRAVDNGLVAIIFEVELFKDSQAIWMDTDRVIFPVGTIFRLKSIDRGPDEVWYVKMTYARSDLHSIIGQLHSDIGTPLTWLTFGTYLHKLGRFRDANSYYMILEKKLPERHPDLPSIYNNIGIMYTLTDDLSEASRYYDLAEACAKLVGSAVTNRTRLPDEASVQIDKTLPLNTAIDRSSIFGHIADIYLEEGNYQSAVENYKKAFESCADLQRCENYQRMLFLASERIQ